jgi:hypothetical protein
MRRLLGILLLCLLPSLGLSAILETDLDHNGAVDVQFGGTNATTAAQARVNLGLNGAYQPLNTNLIKAARASLAGDSKYFGTNSSGIVGFYNLPSGGSGEGGTNYLAGNGILISNNTISVNNALFQPLLVSGVNLKTINGVDLTTGGNLTISGGGGGVDYTGLSALPPAANYAPLSTAYGVSAWTPIAGVIAGTGITFSGTDPVVMSVTASTYQPLLVSATNIKTINGNSLLGSGDLTVSGGGTGGYVASPPAHSDVACTPGQYAISAGYKYDCSEAGVWGFKTALTVWDNPTPGGSTFDQHFTSTVNFSTNTYLGAIASGGTFTQTTTSPGTVSFDEYNVSQANAIFLKNAVALATSQTISVTSHPSFSWGADSVLMLSYYSSDPAVGASSGKVTPVLITIDGSNHLRFIYLDTGGGAHSWNGSSWVSGSTGNAYTSPNFAGSYYVFDISSNGTNVTFHCYEADGTTLRASASIAISALQTGSGSIYALFGDPYNDIWDTNSQIIDRIRVY